MGIGGRQCPATETLQVRMSEDTGDQEFAEPASAVSRLDVDVAEVGVGRAIGHHPRKAGLLAGGRLQPERQ